MSPSYLSFFVLVTDVTPLKQAYAEVEGARLQLEQRVADRTVTLERANASLRREIEEHERTLAALAASLREKEVLLKEVHHRVKNNLQVISSLLSLRASQGHSSPAVFLELQSRVRSISLFHEKMYRRPYAELLEASRVPPVVAYVHNSPVRTRVVAWAGDTSWSSHRAYLGLEPPVTGLPPHALKSLAVPIWDHDSFRGMRSASCRSKPGLSS